MFRGDVHSVDYEHLMIMMKVIIVTLMTINTEKLEMLEDYLNRLIEIISNQ